MAATKKTFVSALVFCLFFLALPGAHNAQLLKHCKFDAIYNLGDSISDTGNLIQETPQVPFGHLPYGQYFNKPTGRCSNGMLIIDFLARSAGLPYFVDAYLNPNATFKSGVNFAVAGATALPLDVLAKRNVMSPGTHSSLATQLNWMAAHFNTTFHNDTDRKQKLKSALFMVGEIGGNDFNYAFLNGRTVNDTMSLVPDVVQAIKHAVKSVIGFGATKVIVPGNFPIGCLPVYLTIFHTNNTKAYDESHCLKEFNEFSTYQNGQVQQAIQDLKEEFPHVTIVYADYYNAYLSVFRRAALLGFDVNSIQKACCGTGGDYNFNITMPCGVPTVPVCADARRFMNFDGVHSTQATYYHMTRWLIGNIFPKLQCSLFN